VLKFKEMETRLIDALPALVEFHLRSKEVGQPTEGPSLPEPDPRLGL